MASGFCNFYLEHDWQVCLFGSANESELADELMKHVTTTQGSNCLDLTGKTSLSDAIDLLALQVQHWNTVVRAEHGRSPAEICDAVLPHVVAVFMSTSGLRRIHSGLSEPPRFDDS